MARRRDEFQITAPLDRYTRPPPRLLHLITDSELEALEHSDHDNYFHVSLATAGITVGLLPNCCAIAIAIANKQMPSFVDLMSLFLFAITLTSTVCFGWVMIRRLPSTKSRIEEIRGRPALPLRPGILSTKSTQKNTEQSFSTLSKEIDGTASEDAALNSSLR